MRDRSEQVSRRGLIALLGSYAGLGMLLQGCRADGEEGTSDAGAIGAAEPDAAGGPLEPLEGQVCRSTSADVEGPYYEPGAPARIKIAADDERGARLFITGTVYEPDCRTPLAGALIEVWQADHDGNYHSAEEQYRLRGQLSTDQQGRYVLETIVPGRYALGGGFRPAHIHYMVTHPGHESLTTQLYFAGDPYLPPHDACGAGCNAGQPERVIKLVGSPLAGTFDIVLASS